MGGPIRHYYPGTTVEDFIDMPYSERIYLLQDLAHRVDADLLYQRR